MKIAIIGFGRFGKLLSEILSPYGDIFIISCSPAIGKNIKQIEYEDLQNMDWIIPAVPISALEESLKKINPYLKKNSLIMDVCSVKVLPCKWLEKNVSKDIQIIGTHPMFGPDSAKNGTAGLQIVICPLRISHENLKKLKSILNSLELKIIETTPDDHDKQTAISLGMVHFLGRGLSELDMKKIKITSLGFERLLAVNETVKNDTWQLFLDMHQYNPYSGEVREKLIASLVKLNQKIKEKKDDV